MFAKLRSFALTASSRKAEILTAGLFALVLAALTQAPMFAQLPDFDNVTGTVQEKIAPAITLFRYIVAIVCFVSGMWEAYKASKGNSKGWMNFMLLWIVAGVCVAPGAVLDLLGLTTLKQELGDWGLGF